MLTSARKNHCSIRRNSGKAHVFSRLQPTHPVTEGGGGKGTVKICQSSFGSCTQTVWSAVAAGQTALYENIGRHEALWTFDIIQSAWSQRRATGDLPEPHLVCALATANSRAYVLANDPEGSRRLEVYELDLDSWEWRRLPAVGTQPACRRAASAVVVQARQQCSSATIKSTLSCASLHETLIGYDTISSRCTYLGNSCIASPIYVCHGFNNAS